MQGVLLRYLSWSWHMLYRLLEHRTNSSQLKRSLETWDEGLGLRPLAKTRQAVRLVNTCAGRGQHNYLWISTVYPDLMVLLIAQARRNRKDRSCHVDQVADGFGLHDPQPLPTRSAPCAGHELGRGCGLVGLTAQEICFMIIGLRGCISRK